MSPHRLHLPWRCLTRLSLRPREGERVWPRCRGREGERKRGRDGARECPRDGARECPREGERDCGRERAGARGRARDWWPRGWCSVLQSMEGPAAAGLTATMLRLVAS